MPDTFITLPVVLLDLGSCNLAWRCTWIKVKGQGHEVKNMFFSGVLQRAHVKLKVKGLLSQGQRSQGSRSKVAKVLSVHALD